jgi:simple sugar transport system substrate-binding protein
MNKTTRRINMKKIIAITIIVSLLLVLSTAQVLAKQYTIAVTTKTKCDWFDRLNVGIKRFAEETGHDVFQLDPVTPDPALQVKIIEDFIAQGVDAICVVPTGVETVEPVLKKAMDRGIIVIAHEAANLNNCHYDVEAFDNYEYGAHLMDEMAKRLNYEGKYIQFVGHLTAKSHNQWVDGAYERQQEKYPKMVQAVPRIESHELIDTSYQKTKEILKVHPDIRGFQGSSAADVCGIGLAIEEYGLEDQTVVLGTSFVSLAGKYLETGAVDMISFWDPADAGYIMCKVATMLLDGQEVKEGMDLGLDGYRNVTIDGKVISGNAWHDVTVDNMAGWDF